MLDQKSQDRRNYRGIYPGVFTMGNLFCGFMSILSAFDGEATHAAWFIVLGFFLDGLDGLVARATRGQSRFGVELDSLADLVTFGVAPAVMIYSLKLRDFGKWGWILGFVFVMCGAFRLARFNLNARGERSTTFVGLPIPAAASLLASYTIFCYDIWGEFVWHKFLVIMVIGASALMVSSIQYEGRPYSIRSIRDRVKFGYIFVGIIALLIAPRKAFFPLAFVYVVSGVAREVFLTMWAGFGYGRSVLKSGRESAARRIRRQPKAKPQHIGDSDVQDATGRPAVPIRRRHLKGDEERKTPDEKGRHASSDK